MIYLTLIALASLIHAGAWMFAAPARALTIVNRVSDEIGKYDRDTMWPERRPVPETFPVRVAFRFVGLGLVLLSVMRLHQLA